MSEFQVPPRAGMRRIAGCALAALLLGRSPLAERPQGGTAASSQFSLATDARGGLANASGAAARAAGGLGAGGAARGFEDELCGLLGPPGNGRKLIWHPSTSVQISVKAACELVHDTAATSRNGTASSSRVLTLDFLEAHRGVTLEPIFGVQYWGYLQPGHTGLAGDATGWVLGANDDGPGVIKAESFEPKSADVQPFFFGKAFQESPPIIFLAGVDMWSNKGDKKKDRELVLGTKEQTLDAPLEVRNDAIKKKTRIWFSEKPSRWFPEHERGLLVLGLPLNEELWNNGLTGVGESGQMAKDAIGLQNASAKKTDHHPVSHGSKVENGACPKSVQGVASCLNENYICTITKSERNETTGKVYIHFRSTCDKEVSEGPLQESTGKAPRDSRLFWDDGEAKVVGTSTSKNNPQSVIAGKITYSGVPKDINIVRFRYGRAGCSLDRKSSYSEVELLLVAQGAAGACRRLLLAFLSTAAAARGLTWRA